MKYVKQLFLMFSLCGFNCYGGDIINEVLTKKLNNKYNYYGMDQFVKNNSFKNGWSFGEKIGNVKKATIDDKSSGEFVSLHLYGDRFQNISFFAVYSKTKKIIIFQEAIFEKPKLNNDADNIVAGEYGDSPVYLLLNSNSLLVWNPFLEDAGVICLSSICQNNFKNFSKITKKINIKNIEKPFSVLLGPDGTSEMTLVKNNKMLLPIGGGFYSWVEPDPKKIWR